MKRLAPLDGELKASIYLQLSQLDRAGIAPLQALPKIQAKEAQPRIKALLRRLEAGAPLSQAGRQTGLFDQFDSAAIAAGEASGNYPFAQLGELHRTRARRRAKARSRMWLPLAVLLLALMVRPLPELVGGGLGIGEYLLSSVGVFALLIAILGGLSRLPGLLRHWGMANQWDGLLLALPIIGNLVRRRNMLEFARALGLLSKAGLPMFEALPQAASVVNNGHLQAGLEDVEQALRDGATVGDALAHSPDLDHKLLALAGTGDYAGTIDAMLLEYVRLEEEELNDAEDRLATWAPRLIYVLVALWMIVSIANMGPPGSLEALQELDP
jgi:type II secretory pathway component PulF